MRIAQCVCHAGGLRVLLLAHASTLRLQQRILRLCALLAQALATRSGVHASTSSLLSTYAAYQLCGPCRQIRDRPARVVQLPRPAPRSRPPRRLKSSTLLWLPCPLSQAPMPYGHALRPPRHHVPRHVRHTVPRLLRHNLAPMPFGFNATRHKHHVLRLPCHSASGFHAHCGPTRTPAPTPHGSHAIAPLTFMRIAVPSAPSLYAAASGRGVWAGSGDANAGPMFLASSGLTAASSAGHTADAAYGCMLPPPRPTLPSPPHSFLGARQRVAAAARVLAPPRRWGTTSFATAHHVFALPTSET